MQPRIVCLGGAVVDRTYRCPAPLQRDTSNPAVSRLGFGGVARNVAETLARLGLPVALISRVGSDPGGAALLAHAAAAGIDVSGVDIAAGQATAEYVAVLEPDGSLAFGLADMALLATITPDQVARSRPAIRDARWLFADCNLSSETMIATLALAHELQIPLIVDAVSTAKVARLPDDLSGVDVLFLNQDEAAVLTNGAADPLAALLARGLKRLVLTQGAAGARFADAHGQGTVPARSVAVVDVTGAGDALVAGTLAALAHGASLASAVALGTELAAHTVGTPASVWPGLTPAFLNSLL